MEWLRRVSLVVKPVSMRQDRGVNSAANHQGIIAVADIAQTVETDAFV